MRRLHIERVREDARRRDRVQVRRVVRVRAEHVQVERRLVLDQAPAGAAAEVDVPLGSPHRHERAAPAQRVVAHADVREVANGSETRLRDDFDRRAAGVVVLGGELIARDADRSNLRLRGQRGALEAIDADDGAGPGHVLQLLLQNRGIVGERLDLIASERGAERRAVAIGRRFLLVLTDRERRFDARDGENRHLLVVAVAHADVGERARVEAGERRLDAVASRPQAGDDRDSRTRCFHRLDRNVSRRILRAGDRHHRAGNDGAGRIDHRHAQRAVCRRLRVRMRAPEEDEECRERAPHFGTSNFFASIFTLMRMRSKVVSSMVCPATACRMRNGHFVPLTSRKSA